MLRTKMMLATIGGVGLIDPNAVTSWKDIGIAGLAIAALIVIWRDGKKEQHRREKTESEFRAQLQSLIERDIESRATNTEVLRGCVRRRKEDG